MRMYSEKPEFELAWCGKCGAAWWVEATGKKHAIIGCEKCPEHAGSILYPGMDKEVSAR